MVSSRGRASISKSSTATTTGPRLSVKEKDRSRASPAEDFVTPAFAVTRHRAPMGIRRVSTGIDAERLPEGNAYLLLLEVVLRGEL